MTNTSTNTNTNTSTNISTNTNTSTDTSTNTSTNISTNTNINTNTSTSANAIKVLKPIPLLLSDSYDDVDTSNCDMVALVLGLLRAGLLMAAITGSPTLLLPVLDRLTDRSILP